MKKGIFAIMALMLLVILSFNVLASDISYSLDDEYQERCNPYEDGDKDEVDDYDDISYGVITVTGVDGVKFDSIEVDISDYYVEGDMDLDLDEDGTFDGDDVLYEPTKVSMKSDNSAEVKFIVPQYLDSVDDDGDEVSHAVLLTVKYNKSGNQNTTNLRVEFKAENNLRISGDIHFESDYNSAKCDVDKEDGVDCDDDDLDQFVPGETMYMEFTLKNDMDDADMEDIEIDIDVTGDEDDYDDGDDDFDLDSKDEKDFKFSIDPEDDAEDIDIEITVVGEDEFNARQGFRYNIDNDIEFDDPDYEIKVDLLSVPTTACLGEEVLLSFKVTNRGTKDQDNIRVQVKESNLGWSKVDSVSLDGEDDGDYESHTFNFYLTVPSNAKPMNYPVQLVTYYEDDDSYDATVFQNINLNVVDCSADEEEEEEEVEEIVVVPPTNGNDPGNGDVVPTNPSVPTTPGGSDVIIAEPTGFDWSTFGIISVVILLLVAIIVLIVFLFKK